MRAPGTDRRTTPPPAPTAQAAAKVLCDAPAVRSRRYRKTVQQLLHAFRRLGAVLRPVLAPGVLIEAAAQLVQAVCQQIMGEGGRLPLPASCMHPHGSCRGCRLPACCLVRQCHAVALCLPVRPVKTLLLAPLLRAPACSLATAVAQRGPGHGLCRVMPTPAVPARSGCPAARAPEMARRRELLPPPFVLPHPPV